VVTDRHGLPVVVLGHKPEYATSSGGQRVDYRIRRAAGTQPSASATERRPTICYFHFTKGIASRAASGQSDDGSRNQRREVAYLGHG
jgi:hypothetical protein